MGMVHIIGGGLAGCEAAWQCLQLGLSVRLYEMRPTKKTEAHQTGDLAELVCSNSLKSLDPDSPSGLLKREMTALNSLIVRSAFEAQVPAGGALAVDRVQFSTAIENALKTFSNFERVDQEVTDLSSFPESDVVIVASGPLTSDGLGQSLIKMSGEEAKNLYFYDAIAPVIMADSIDMSVCYYANRYGKGSDQSEDGGDYINVPLNKEQYEEFIDAVETSEKAELHHFESTKYFESCLPIEVMVERGRETLRFGPMKPVGLENPHTGHRPWAVIQLRQENRDKTMFSMVGFQTKMKWGEQKRIFASLPGLRDAEFLRFGSVHRNTYLHSPKILKADLSLQKSPHIFLAGQITGVEGYLESSSIGLLAGRFAGHKLNGTTFTAPPRTSMLGALHDYITVGPLGPYQPMNTNMGLFPQIPSEGKKMPKKLKRAKICDRARSEFKEYLVNYSEG